MHTVRPGTCPCYLDAWSACSLVHRRRCAVLPSAVDRTCQRESGASATCTWEDMGGHPVVESSPLPPPYERNMPWPNVARGTVGAGAAEGLGHEEYVRGPVGATATTVVVSVSGGRLLCNEAAAGGHAGAAAGLKACMLTLHAKRVVGTRYYRCNQPNARPVHHHSLAPRIHIPPP